MKKFNSQLPKEMQGKVKFNFCGPSGADAIEAAIKLARICTSRQNILAFEGAYHGMTEGALSITDSDHHKKDLSHIKSNNVFLPFCNCYRCAFGKDKDDCNLECAQNVRKSVERFSSQNEKPAAIITEPVQGEGGTIIPKKEFIEQLMQIGKEFDILIIFDEIQAGFYRTGYLFSFQYFNVIPDIVTVSKGIGGIGMPLALLIIKKEFDRWDSGTHAGTFRGNQLSISAGLKALEFVENNNIEEHVKELSKKMMDFLLEMMKNSKFIGDVRGLGLMFGIEYVKDKKNKEPFPEFVKELRNQCYKNGLLLEVGGVRVNVVRMLPPLISTDKIAFRGLEIFQKVNKIVEQRFK